MYEWNEQAAAEWAAHGVLHGRMTPEEWDAGGVWLLGDRLPDGYPGKTSGFCYKSWCSRPKEKYAPGNYPMKDRVKEDHWEFVQVLDGCLECIVEENGRTMRFPLEHPELVDISPAPKRLWRFAEGKKSFASGIAFFRKLVRPPLQPGAGEGYEFRLWDSSTLDRLRGPLNLPSWRVQLVEVFDGDCDRMIWCRIPEGAEYFLGPRSHLFLRAGVPQVWNWNGRAGACGIVIYLT